MKFKDKLDDSHYKFGEAYHEMKYVPFFETLMELEVLLMDRLKNELVDNLDPIVAGKIQGIRDLRALREQYMREYLESEE